MAATSSLPHLETSFRKCSLNSGSDAEGLSPSRSLRSPLSSSRKVSVEDYPRCGYCQLVPAAVACPCVHPAKLLCSACFQVHTTEGKQLEHYEVPVTSLGVVQSEEQRQTFFQFVSRFKSLRKELSRNIEVITAFQSSLAMEFDQLISYLHNIKNSHLSQLEKAKIELQLQVESALNQLQDVLYTPDFRPLNDLEIQVLACWTRDPDLRTAQLFTGDVDFTEVRNQVAKSAYFHTQLEYLKSEEQLPDTLVGISFNSLRLFKLPDCQEKRKSLRCSFTVGTFYSFIDSTTALCLGGLPPSNTVQKLNVVSGLLSPGPPMKVARGFSGIKKHGSCVYVFGGNWPSTSSCEKLSLEDNVWQPLPKMSTPRYAFNPVYYKGEMYLADCQNDHSVEVFSVAMETFRLLQITLPAVLSGNSVAFLVGKDLHIATSYGQLAVLNLATKRGEFTVKDATNTPIISSWPPLVVGKVVYFINYSTGELRKYSTDSGRFT